MIKKILYLLIILLLFSFGYTICNLVYPEYILQKGLNANKWWDLRMNLYALLICFMFLLLNSLIKDKLSKLIVLIGVGLSICDIIDRLYFNINIFTKEDILMIFITMIVSFFEAYSKLTIKGIADYIVSKIKPKNKI